MKARAGEQLAGLLLGPVRRRCRSGAAAVHDLRLNVGPALLAAAHGLQLDVPLALLAGAGRLETYEVDGGWKNTHKHTHESTYK